MWMDWRRIGGWIGGGCATLATTIVTMVWPQIDPAIGIPFLAALTVGMVAGFAIALWPDGRWPFVRKRQRGDALAGSWIPLSDAVEYLADRSVWLRGKSVGDGKWVTVLRRDLQDALGTGDIAARGRHPMVAVSESLFGAEPIPVEFWPKAMFVPIPHYSKQDRDRVWAPGANGREETFVDVVVNARDLRRKWRALLPWERPKLTPWAHASEGARRMHEQSGAV
jgi:hypothetical protein